MPCLYKKIERNISNECFSFVIGKDTCSDGEKQLVKMFYQDEIVVLHTCNYVFG
jgi:hypothetical protein